MTRKSWQASFYFMAKTLILGAGMTGLAAGIKTGATVYEASDHAGGICTSYIKDGFQFSHGGPHVIFGKGKGLEYIKSLVPVNEYARKAGVYYNHTFPYPFQTSAQKDIENPPEWTLESLKMWLLDKFGKEQCNLFFHPFNEKYTAGLYDEVIQADEFKSPPAGGVGFVSTFCDPVNGLSSLVERMAEQCNIQYNKRVVKINAKAKTVLFDDGEVVWYDKLISTIPLNQSLAMCDREDVDLPYTSVLVLNIGADKDVNAPDDHWLYIPFCKGNFYRLGFYSNIDPTKAPPLKVGLSVEMAFHGVEYEELSLPFIIETVIDELQAWRFIGKVITVDPTWVKTGYTWMRSKSDRDNALQWLKERDIISTGRYGKWQFQGMTQSIEDGFEVEI